METAVKMKRLATIAIVTLAVLFINEDRLQAAPPDLPPGLKIAAVVQEAHTPALMGIPGVVGTAVGFDSLGQAVIQVFLASEGERGIPRFLNGVRVETRVTGPLIAYKGPPSGKGPPGGNGDGDSGQVDPKAIQTPPIKLGTSGGWRYDLANGYCCGGTLGSLIKIGDTKYILSNYHVLYADIVQGGNGWVAQSPDPVIQPGLIDVMCRASDAQNVATLVLDGGSLPDANIDAGIAQVIPGMVDETGAILNIGTISASTVGAFDGQPVKKMGRTTGLSRSKVDGVNGTVSITYSNECAGGTAFTRQFTRQIIIQNKACKFLNGGDSGSLMVEDVDPNPRAVGLLFAGSSICAGFSIGIANPIDDVLGHYSQKFNQQATMVGN